MYGLDTSSVSIDFIGTGGVVGNNEQEALVLFSTGEGSTIITDYHTVLFNGGTGEIPHIHMRCCQICYMPEVRDRPQVLGRHIVLHTK